MSTELNLTTYFSRGIIPHATTVVVLEFARRFTKMNGKRNRVRHATVKSLFVQAPLRPQESVYNDVITETNSLPQANARILRRRPWRLLELKP